MKTLTYIVVVIVALVNLAVAGDRDWTGIVVHHSDSGPETTSEDINNWHKEKGWSEIGYHYVIEWDGKVRDARPLSKSGAHAKTGAPKSRNSTHIGICLVGRDTFSRAQLSKLQRLVAMLCKEFDIKTIERHHEQCPGPGVDVESLDVIVRNFLLRSQ